MKKLHCLLSVSVATILFAHLSCHGAPIKVFEDTFGSSHTYWDGTTVSLANGWQGIMHEATASNISANIIESGCLTFSSSPGVSADAEDGDYDAPQLYIVVTGDFEAVIKVLEPMPEASYDNMGIMAANPDLSINHIEAYAFPIKTSWGDKNCLRVTLDGTSTTHEDVASGVARPWIKLTRSGNDFYTYAKAVEGDAWALVVGPVSVPTMPSVLNVGPYFANYNTLGGVYSYEVFELWQDMNAVLSVSPDLYKKRLIYDQTNAFSVKLMNGGGLATTWSITNDPVSWLTVHTPATTNLNPNESVDIGMTLDASGFSSPERLTNLVIFVNEGDFQPTCTVIMTVGPVTKNRLVFVDNFATAYTYWDGAAHVPANGWEGIMFPEMCDEISAYSDSENDYLYVNCGTNNSQAGEGTHSCPLLYVPLTGDFTAVIQLREPIDTRTWVNYGVMAREGDIGRTNYVSAQCFGWHSRPMAVFNVKNASHTRIWGPESQPRPWIKMVREDSDFSLYSRPDVKTEWELINSGEAVSRPDLPDALNVGPFVATYVNYQRSVAFELFKVYRPLPLSESGLTDVQVSASRLEAPLQFGATTSLTFSINNSGATTDWHLAYSPAAWLTLCPTNGTLGLDESVCVTAGFFAAEKGLSTESVTVKNGGVDQPSIILAVNCTIETTNRLIFSDHFDSNHTYWDGSSVDVAGTPWSGVLFPDSSSQISANNPEASLLAVDIPLDAFTGLEGGHYYAPCLYCVVTGDFEAITELDTPLPEEEWDNLGMLANNPDLIATSYVFVAAFETVSATSTRSVTSDEATTENADDAHEWLKMVRMGNGFTLSSRTATSDWREVYSYGRPDMPDAIQVGPFAANFTSNAGTYYFDSFELYAVDAVAGQFLVTPSSLEFLPDETQKFVTVSSPVSMTADIEVVSGTNWLSAPASVSPDNEHLQVPITAFDVHLEDSGLLRFTSVEDPSRSYDVSATVVPEPASLVLILLAAAGITTRRNM